MDIFDAVIITIWASWAGLGLSLMYTQNQKLDRLFEQKTEKKDQS